jgi:hypothetical protein
MVTTVDARNTHEYKKIDRYHVPLMIYSPLLKNSAVLTDRYNITTLHQVYWLLFAIVIKSSCQN